MILECVPHGTLYDVIHSKFEMTNHIRLKIAENIASAVNRLHSIKPPIIHRDLKTPNILVSSLDASSSVLVKLADMGLSCRATSEVKSKKPFIDCLQLTKLCVRVGQKRQRFNKPRLDGARGHETTALHRESRRVFFRNHHVGAH